MKKFNSHFQLLLLFILLISNSTAQNSPLIFKDTIKFGDTTHTSSILYKNALQWIHESFPGLPSSSIKEFPDFGEITFSAKLKYESKVFERNENTSGEISFIALIKIKNGEYSIDFKQFRHMGVVTQGSQAFSFGLITFNEECTVEFINSPGEKWKQKVWRDIKSQIQAQVSQMTETLRIKMDRVN